MQPEIIKNLYAVFSKYTLHEKVTGCYCGVCLTEDDNIYCHSTPLQSVAPEWLSRYFSSVGILEENYNDYKYFIPRILELAYLNQDNGSWFFETIRHPFKEAKYKEWNIEEVSTINNFLKFCVEESLTTNDEERKLHLNAILQDLGYIV